MNDPNQNDQPTTWSGTPTTNAAISETEGVTNQSASELATNDYVAVGTFKPLDADGDGFEYAIDESKDGWWLFDYDPSTGILSLKYELDYESTNFPPVVDVSIWVHGTAGGAPTNAASGVWINHNFTLSILNVEEDSSTDGINNSPISWDGVSASAAISETADVENQGELTEANYKTIATLTPKDDDGDGFQYAIAGDQAYLFTIGSDGELKLKYNLDYESNLYPPVIKIAIWGHGTGGGDAAGVGAGTAWLPHEFALTILNVEDNTNKTEWSGTQPTLATVNEDPAAVNSQNGYRLLETPVAVATFAASDADGDKFEYRVSGDASYTSIDSNGVLYSLYSYDYESNIAGFSGNQNTMVVWVRGVSDGDPSGDAVADTLSVGSRQGWITTSFVLSIANLNDESISWAGVSSTATINETADVINQGAELATYNPIATLAPTDPDGDGFSYSIQGNKDQFWLFDISANGVLSLKYNLDYESAWYPPVAKTTIWATGTGGGDAVGRGTNWLPFEFTLTILDVNDVNRNEYITAWSGTLTTDASLRETINVENQGASELATADYVAVATFTPLDADGAGFEYAFDQSKAGWWLFDYDPSSGVLSVKYQLDYESAWYSPVVDVSIWVHGTAGGAATNAASGVWINHNFVLSIENVNEAINDEAISWSGNQPAVIAAEESAGVENLRFDLTTSEYVAVATFTPKDADGDEFGYGLSGDYAWMFDIGTDGVLTLKFELDYESTFFDTTNFSATVWAGGLSGGTPVGDAVPWISHNFVLSVVNVGEDGVNDTKTEWSGSQPTSTSVAEDATITGTASVSAGKTPVAIATFAASDVNGNEFEYDVQLNGAGTNYFSMDSDGVLYTTAGFN
ncbi:MAG: cadherin repeat domain-containing protein [Gammaproteobacteria bacterium]